MDENMTGNEELDAFMSDEKGMGTIGKLSVSKCQRRHITAKPKIDDIKTLTDMLDEFDAKLLEETRHTMNIFLLYQGRSDNVKDVFEQIRGKFSADVGVCAGSVASGIMVYIRKQDHRKLPSFDIVDSDGAQRSAVAYRFKRSGNVKKNMEQTMTAFTNTLGDTITDLVVRPPPNGGYSFEQLLTGASKLTPLQLATKKGQIDAVPPKERSDLEKAFLRALPELKNVKTLSSKRATGITFQVDSPPFPVVPLTHLLGLEHQGRRFIERTRGASELVTLNDLFRDASYMSKYVVLILGESSTTGYGKTQMALRLAMEWARSMTEAQQLPMEEAQVVFTNTVDAAKNIKFKQGMVWVLDEFSPGDHEQAVHCSEKMLKILFSPSTAATIRCRN